MKVFDFDAYKPYVLARIRAMPKNGRGQLLQIARLLGVHTTMITHIFRGDANLSVEHALKLANYFGMTELERDYLVTLVQIERAGDHAAQAYFRSQLSKLKAKALNLAHRLEVKKVLTEKDQAFFYSSWHYSGVRLMVAIEPFQSADAIAEKLQLPLKMVQQAVEFLISVGLLKEVAGKLLIGESRTYVDRDSPLAARHHINWRLKTMQNFDRLPIDQLAFTNPVTVSAKDFQRIREEIVRLIERFRQIADPSEPEILACLNLDWTRIS